MWGHPATKLSRAENRTRIKNALKAFHRFSFSVTTDYVLLTPRVFVWWANGPRQNDVARFLEEFRSETCEPCNHARPALSDMRPLEIVFRTDGLLHLRRVPRTVRSAHNG